MTGLKNKHKEIVGQTLRKDHLKKWDEQKFLEWFRMMHHFAPKGDWIWNDVTLKAYCEQAATKPHWEEWMWRFSMNSEETKPNHIGRPITGFVRHIGEYLQSNPFVITPQMKEIMLGNKTLTKYTEPFKVITTAIGAEIVVPNVDDGSVLTLPEVQYHKALLKMSALANALTEGITEEHIKKLAPDERIKLALSIVKMMSTIQGGQKPNTQIFKQLIVNNAGRDDLEKAMLAYAE